jgi:hypothetical protein
MWISFPLAIGAVVSPTGIGRRDLLRSAARLCSLLGQVLVPGRRFGARTTRPHDRVTSGAHATHSIRESLSPAPQRWRGTRRVEDGRLQIDEVAQAVAGHEQARTTRSHQGHQIVVTGIRRNSRQRWRVGDDRGQALACPIRACAYRATSSVSDSAGKVTVSAFDGTSAGPATIDAGFAGVYSYAATECTVMCARLTVLVRSPAV